MNLSHSQFGLLLGVKSSVIQEWEAGPCESYQALHNAVLVRMRQKITQMSAKDISDMLNDIILSTLPTSFLYWLFRRES